MLPSHFKLEPAVSAIPLSHYPICYPLICYFLISKILAVLGIIFWKGASFLNEGSSSLGGSALWWDICFDGEFQKNNWSSLRVPPLKETLKGRLKLCFLLLGRSNWGVFPDAIEAKNDIHLFCIIQIYSK